MLNFSTTFKALRLEKGMSQHELANALDVSKSSISMYERNEREPDLATINRIAKYFNVSVDFLITGKNEPKPHSKLLNHVSVLLGDIYGGISHKLFGEIDYYIIGTGKDKFILSADDMNELLDYVTNTLPFFINKLKYIKSEEEFIYKQIDSLPYSRPEKKSIKEDFQKLYKRSDS